MEGVEKSIEIHIEEIKKNVEFAKQEGKNQIDYVYMVSEVGLLDPRTEMVKAGILERLAIEGLQANGWHQTPALGGPVKLVNFATLITWSTWSLDGKW